MNINYHYFAVKALAVKAGFEEDEAQLIASYSQFVDDFDAYSYIYIKDVPEYAQHLAAKLLYGWAFNPVTTGINSFFDYVRLSLERYQKRILVPFHFMPSEPLRYDMDDRKEYRVKPVTLDDGSLLQGLLSKAAAAYKDLLNRDSLIRIGTLLHILADSYAHQRFSGFHGWENHSFLKEVIDNISQENVTESYDPKKYYYVPSIGHPNVNTAPDDSNITFTMLQKDNKDEEFPYKDRYKRDNVTEFLKCSKVIINYLRDCRKLKPILDDEWIELSSRLTVGFLTTEKEKEGLIKHWSPIFPETTFHYNKNGLISNDTSLEQPFNPESNSNDISDVSISNFNDDFFRFNIIAENIRKAVDPNYIGDEEFLKYKKALLSVPS